MTNRIALVWNRPGGPPCEVPVIDGILHVPSPLLIDGKKTQISYLVVDQKADNVSEGDPLTMTIWKDGAWTWDD